MQELCFGHDLLMRDGFGGVVGGGGGCLEGGLFLFWCVFVFHLPENAGKILQLNVT